MGLGAVNAYLIPLDEGGWMLVDCGMDTPACWRIVTAAIEGLDVRRILVTHYHPDHFGLAPRLVEHTGAELWMSRAETDWLAEVATSMRRRDPEIMRAAGTPEELIAAVDRAFDPTWKMFQAVAPDRILTGGERIGEWEVQIHAGHSPGLVCLYHAPSRTLLSGDQMLPNTTPNIAWMPGHDCLGDYLDSLARLRAMDIGEVWPSHGEAFTGHAGWIDRTRRHHQERCDRIVSALESGATPHQLTEVLWDRGLPPFKYRFAIYEVLAHLEHLAKVNVVTKVAPPDGRAIQWWVRL